MLRIITIFFSSSPSEYAKLYTILAIDCGVKSQSIIQILILFNSFFGVYKYLWFLFQFQNLSNLSEGDIAHFEASLTPVGDQTMVVEWFYKGEVLKAS
jgi:hypothetical protein